MLCIIFSVGFSLRLLKGSYLFPQYSKNIVNPLAELLGSFERNHRVTRRRLNPLFRLIFYQYSKFRGPQCIPRGYMDTRMTWKWCYSSQLDSGLLCALFCSLYQPISLSRSPRQGIRAWFSAQSGTADQVISLFFRHTGWKIWVPLIFNGFHIRFRGCPANFMSAAMLWKAGLCFLPIVVRITFEQNTKSC